MYLSHYILSFIAISHPSKIIKFSVHSWLCRMLYLHLKGRKKRGGEIREGKKKEMNGRDADGRKRGGREGKGKEGR